MAENRFKYRITAQDDTAKGVKSAQKRVGELEKGVQRYTSAMEKAGRRSPLSHATRSFTGVHGSMLKALGGASSPLGKVADRIGAVTNAAGEMRVGLAAAAEEGGALASTLGTVGVVAGGTVGVLLAAGLAGYKFASGWVEGGAALGRLSQQLGMTTADIQKFQTAGERFGIDKGDMAGALGGAGSVMHEAVYGRNNEALAAMNSLGIQIKRGADGRPDTSAMMMDLADAIARQKDPYTQARIAGIFGVTGALPLLRQGRKGVQAELDDSGKYGAILSDRDVGDATRIQKTGIEARQAGERVSQAAQAHVARFETAHVNDMALATARAGVDQMEGRGPRVSQVMAEGVSRFSSVVVDHVVPAARTMERAANEMFGASEAMAAGVPGGAGSRRVSGLARRGLGAQAYFASHGWTPEQAAGIAANLVAESGLNPRRIGDNGAAYGLGQWHPDRQAEFKRWAGHDIRHSTLEEQLGFVNYELTQGRERPAGQRLRGAQTAGEAGASVSEFYERPFDVEHQAALRAAIADAISQITVNNHHHITVTGPRGTTAHVRSTTQSSSSVAIGNAMVGNGP